MITVAVDRTKGGSALVIGVTLLLFSLAFIAEANPDAPRPLTDALIGFVVGVPFVLFGYAATSRVRPVGSLSPLPHWQRAFRTAVLGAAIAAANLLILRSIAAFDESVLRIFHGASVAAWAPLGTPLARALSAAVVEEVVGRLFIMGGIAWIASRFRRTPRDQFLIALVGSSAIFGMLHFAGFTWGAPILVLLNVGAGLLLGWFYWRWGLQYAILAHLIGGLMIQGLGPIMIG